MLGSRFSPAVGCRVFTGHVACVVAPFLLLLPDLLLAFLHLFSCSTASEVTLKDSAIPKGLKLIDGSLEASLGKIDVGSSVQHTYVLAAETGSFGAEFEPATVTYQPEFDSKEKQVCWFVSGRLAGSAAQVESTAVAGISLLASSLTTPAYWQWA